MLLSLCGIAVAQRLYLIILFRLPNATTSFACLADFRSNLSALSLPSVIITTCFPLLAKLSHLPRLLRRHPHHPELDHQAQQQLLLRLRLPPQPICLHPVLRRLNAGLTISSQLTALNGNASHDTNCFYLTIIYAAGVVNQYGLEDAYNVGCIFGLPPSSPFSLSHSKSHAAAIFTPIVAILALALLLLALGFYIRCSKFKKKRNVSSLENQE